MAVSQDFLDFILDQLGDPQVQVRRMFGGAGLYGDGLMFALVADDVLYLRTDAVSRGAFERLGMEPFKPYPDRPVRMPYYQCPADVLEDADQLAAWSREARAAARRVRGGE